MGGLGFQDLVDTTGFQLLAAGFEDTLDSSPPGDWDLCPAFQESASLPSRMLLLALGRLGMFSLASNCM